MCSSMPGSARGARSRNSEALVKGAIKQSEADLLAKAVPAQKVYGS